MDLTSYFPICIGFRKPNSEEDRNTFLIFYLFILKCAHPQKLSETDHNGALSCPDRYNV